MSKTYRSKTRKWGSISWSWARWRAPHHLCLWPVVTLEPLVYLGQREPSRRLILAWWSRRLGVEWKKEFKQGLNDVSFLNSTSMLSSPEWKVFIENMHKTYADIFEGSLHEKEGLKLIEQSIRQIFEQHVWLKQQVQNLGISNHYVRLMLGQLVSEVLHLAFEKRHHIFAQNTSSTEKKRQRKPQKSDVPPSLLDSQEKPSGETWMIIEEEDSLDLEQESTKHPVIR